MDRDLVIEFVLICRELSSEILYTGDTKAVIVVRLSHNRCGTHINIHVGNEITIEKCFGARAENDKTPPQHLCGGVLIYGFGRRT
jgi:hypothetical protein